MMKCMHDITWNWANGNSYLNSTLATTSNLVTSTCLVIVTFTTTIIRFVLMSLYTCKRQLYNSQTSMAQTTKLNMLILPFPLIQTPYPPPNAQLFNIVLIENSPSLNQIIQDIVDTKKSYLIRCIKHALLAISINKSNFLLLLAPVGITTFIIHASIINAGLQITKEMYPLEGQSLPNIQEELKHVCYILINEMSFKGPKLCSCIDRHLHEHSITIKHPIWWLFCYPCC